MKKSIVFVLLMAAMLLAACAQPAAQMPAPTPKQTVDPTAAEQVEVIWYVREDEKEQKWETETVIPQFEQANPNIKINLVIAPYTDFDTIMQSMIAAGTPPDVWSHWGPSGFRDYLQRGLVADLTPFIEKDRFDLSDFQEGPLDVYGVDGKIMGLPMFTSGSFVFYNKDLFDKADISYPPTSWDDTSWTWDAFLNQCKALTKVTGDPNNDVFGCSLEAWPENQYSWIWGLDIFPISAYQTGIPETAFLDQQGVVEAFQVRQDMIWKLHYMPDPVQRAALGGADPFKTQKVAMVISGGWGWWNYSDVKDFQWAAAPLPFGAPARKDVVFTDPWLLSSKSNHPQEAWTFLSFLASADMQEAFMNVTGAPPVRESLLEKWYARFPNMTPEEVKEVHLGALKYGNESPSHMLVQFNALNEVVSSALKPVINNEKTAADVLPAANARLIEVLKQIQSASP